MSSKSIGLNAVKQVTASLRILSEDLPGLFGLLILCNIANPLGTKAIVSRCALDGLNKYYHYLPSAIRPPYQRLQANIRLPTLEK